MEKIITAKFAAIDVEQSEITISEFQPSIRFAKFCVRDVKIIFKENSIIEITGHRLLWEMNFIKKPLSEMVKQPMESYIVYKYKNLFDYFRKKKTPFINSGWFQLKKTQPFHCLMHKWILIFNI